MRHLRQPYSELVSGLPSSPLLLLQQARGSRRLNHFYNKGHTEVVVSIIFSSVRNELGNSSLALGWEIASEIKAQATKTNSRQFLSEIEISQFGISSNKISSMFADLKILFSSSLVALLQHKLLTNRT